jgi:NAD-dependent dihydropyrimidine dehydrogenase PreA subunit
MGKAMHLAVGAGLLASRIPLLGRLLDGLASPGRVKAVTVPVGASIKAGPAVLPYDAARRLIESAGYILGLDSCMCRDSQGCRDYPHDLGCLFIGEGARKMAKSGMARQVSTAEALGRLERARSLGLVTNLIWLRPELRVMGADPSRTVEMCFCCPCCCIAVKTKNGSKAFVDAITGLAVSRPVNPEACTRCTNCELGCPFKAIKVDLREGPVIDAERCKGCGRCELACKQGVLKILPLDAAKGGGTLPGHAYLEEFFEMVR